MRNVTVPLPEPPPLLPPQAAISDTRLIPPTVRPPALKNVRRSHCAGLLRGCALSNTNASCLGRLSNRDHGNAVTRPDQQSNGTV